MWISKNISIRDLGADAYLNIASCIFWWTKSPGIFFCCTTILWKKGSFGHPSMKRRKEFENQSFSILFLLYNHTLKRRIFWSPKHKTAKGIKMIDLYKEFSIVSLHLGALHKLCRHKGKGGGGQKLPILLGKKTNRRKEGGQKLPILRQHSLWAAPYQLIV